MDDDKFISFQIEQKTHTLVLFLMFYLFQSVLIILLISNLVVP